MEFTHAVWYILIYIIQYEKLKRFHIEYFAIPVFLILAYDSEVMEFLEIAHQAESFPFSDCAFVTLEVTSTTVINSKWLLHYLI